MPTSAPADMHDFVARRPLTRQALAFALEADIEDLKAAVGLQHRR
jgi:hypothetical protein